MVSVADLADIQLISKYNKGTQCLLRGIDIFCKYAWVIPLKDKKCITITNAFQKILDKSGRKPSKVLVDNYEVMVTRNDIEIYSTDNQGNCDVAETFIRKLKNKICKYNTSILKKCRLMN